MGLFKNKVSGMSPGEVLADASVVDFVATMGTSIARAQKALDENSMAMAAEMAQTTPEFSEKSLLELGLVPAFYHVVEAELEVKMTLSMRVEEELGIDLGVELGSGTPGGGGGAAAAPADLTIDVVVAGGSDGDKVSLRVDGTLTELTLKTSTPGAGEFEKGATDDDTAENLLTAATALTGVTGSRDGATVSLTVSPGSVIATDTGWAVTATGPQVDATITCIAGANGQTITVQRDGVPAKAFEVKSGAHTVAAGAVEVPKGNDADNQASEFLTKIQAELLGLTASVDGAELTLRLEPNEGVWADPFAVVLAPVAPPPKAPSKPKTKTKKQPVVWGVSVNAHYHRRFEMDVTGSSRVTWKIVSLPAPVQFMEELQKLRQEANDA